MRRELGEIVFVEMPRVGAKVQQRNRSNYRRQGHLDMFSPLSGELRVIPEWSSRGRGHNKDRTATAGSLNQDFQSR